MFVHAGRFNLNRLLIKHALQLDGFITILHQHLHHGAHPDVHALHATLFTLFLLHLSHNALLHEGSHPDWPLELHLAGAAHLGVAGALVELLLDAHHVVEELNQFGLSHAHADHSTWGGLE